MSKRMDGSSQAAWSVPDRHDRRPVELRGFAILADGRTIDLTVLNLSYDGCCVETPFDLSVGETIRLSVLRCGAVETQVCWYRNGKAGLAFGPRPEKNEEPQPREARIVVDAEVTLRKPGYSSYRVRLFDVSRKGCQAQFVERPSIGSHVWIKFNGLEALDAEVCWVSDFQVGLRYVHPIHPAVFDLLTKQLAR